MNNQNQGQPSPQAINAQNAQAANAKFQQEAASELAQSPGQVSQYLLSKSQTGFEFGSSLGQNMNAANANFNQNSELNQSNGQINQILARESR